MALLTLTIVGTFAGTMLALEAKAWAPYVSARLLAAAIDRFPDGLDSGMRRRWGEELEADLAGYGDRPLGGLVFAIGVWRRGGKGLAAELALQEVVGAGPRPAQADGAIDLGITMTATQRNEAGDQHVLYVMHSGERAETTVKAGESLVDSEILGRLVAERDANRAARLGRRASGEAGEGP
jgi:hypothetical protein